MDCRKSDQDLFGFVVKPIFITVYLTATANSMCVMIVGPKKLLLLTERSLLYRKLHARKSPTLILVETSSRRHSTFPFKTVYTLLLIVIC